MHFAVIRCLDGLSAAHDRQKLWLRKGSADLLFRSAARLPGQGKAADLKNRSALHPLPPTALQGRKLIAGENAPGTLAVRISDPEGGRFA